jgi:hypothetical protein
MSKENLFSEKKTCDEHCKCLCEQGLFIVCANPDSDHYGHVLSYHHPACLAGIVESDKEEEKG